jgi:hypothetical protein
MDGAFFVFGFEIQDDRFFRDEIGELHSALAPRCPG